MRTHPGACFQVFTDSLPVLGGRSHRARGRAHRASVCRCPRWKMIKLWKTSCSTFMLSTFVGSLGGFVFNFPVIRDSVISIVFPRNPWAYTESGEATSITVQRTAAYTLPESPSLGIRTPRPQQPCLSDGSVLSGNTSSTSPGEPLLSGGTQTP